MKIALIGYGKMGVEIEKIALERGHFINHRFNRTETLSAEKLEESDVAIEFTRPDAAVDNLKLCFKAGTPVVCGTTGWYDQLPEISAECEKTESALFTASNFSLGVNITFFLNKVLAKIMSGQMGYKAGITEIHHTRKLDAPSGTAISLAEGIIGNNAYFSGWELSEDLRQNGKIPIRALREGDVPGTHIIKYAGEIDAIELRHEAFNRKGFALGAVLAAEWIYGKKGVFGMQDMLNFDALIK